MVRTVGALLAATLAGPYTYLLLSWLTNFALDPSVPSLETSIMALPMLMFMGTVGLVLAGVPALLLGASALGFAWKLGLATLGAMPFLLAQSLVRALLLFISTQNSSPKQCRA
jgi:hypothetical protein